MAAVNLKANRREESGKGSARKIRREGMIPAVIYRAGTEATSIAIDPHDLELQFKRSGNPNALVGIDLDGGRDFTCLVREVQRHPVSGVIRHVDFYEVDNNEKIRVSVPVEPVGRAAGTRLGGRLRVIRRTLDVRCLPNDIPATVQIDVTPLNVGEFIRASQVTAPEKTELILEADFNVISVIGKKKGREKAADDDA
ncbi:MAG: 50S ribosomal protein L25 [Myxococcota bacterium]